MNKTPQSKKPKKLIRFKKRKHQMVTIPKDDFKGNECQEFVQILSDFIDLELTENHLVKIRNHLTACVQCTQVYREVRMLIQLCQSESRVEPVNVSSQLWRALEKRFKAKGI